MWQDDCNFMTLCFVPQRANFSIREYLLLHYAISEHDRSRQLWEMVRRLEIFMKYTNSKPCHFRMAYSLRTLLLVRFQRMRLLQVLFWIATSKNSNPLSHDDVNKAIRLTGLTDRKIRGANECSIFSPTISPLHSHFSHLAEDVT
jgi:hypothetical protein